MTFLDKNAPKLLSVLWHFLSDLRCKNEIFALRTKNARKLFVGFMAFFIRRGAKMKFLPRIKMPGSFCQFYGIFYQT